MWGLALRVSPLPDAARQRLGQIEPALRRAQQNQPAVRQNRTALEIGGQLLTVNGWKIEREKTIFGHGGRGALVAGAEGRWTTNFYPIPTTLAAVAIIFIPLFQTKRVSSVSDFGEIFG